MKIKKIGGAQAHRREQYFNDDKKENKTKNTGICKGPQSVPIHFKLFLWFMSKEENTDTPTTYRVITGSIHPSLMWWSLGHMYCFKDGWSSMYHIVLISKKSLDRDLSQECPQYAWSLIAPNINSPGMLLVHTSSKIYIPQPSFKNVGDDDQIEL